jgi:hypothetical protein
MGMASSSSSAATGINAPGGSITKNSPGIWIAAIMAVVILFWLWVRRKG